MTKKSEKFFVFLHENLRRDLAKLNKSRISRRMRLNKRIVLLRVKVVNPARWLKTDTAVGRRQLADHLVHDLVTAAKRDGGKGSEKQALDFLFMTDPFTGSYSFYPLYRKRREKSTAGEFGTCSKKKNPARTLPRGTSSLKTCL